MDRDQNPKRFENARDPKPKEKVQTLAANVCQITKSIVSTSTVSQNGPIRMTSSVSLAGRIEDYGEVSMKVAPVTVTHQETGELIYTHALIDTGAGLSMISTSLVDRMGGELFVPASPVRQTMEIAGVCGIKTKAR